MRKLSTKNWILTLCSLLLVVGCSTLDPPATGPRGATSTPPPTPLPGEMPTIPRPLPSGIIPRPVPSTVPTRPPAPPTSTPLASCSASEAVVGSHVIAITALDDGRSVPLAQGDTIALDLGYSYYTWTLYFANPALLCQVGTTVASSRSIAKYQATHTGTTTLNAVAYPPNAPYGDGLITYTIGLRVDRPAPPGTPLSTDAPSGVYPLYGHAPDYSWIAGQTVDKQGPNQCGYLLYHASDRQPDYDVPVQPVGPIWSAAAARRLVTDRAFVVVFGYLESYDQLRLESPRSCEPPYQVERVLTNPRPAAPASLGPPPDPAQPRVLTEADHEKTIELHVNDRVELLFLGAESGSVQWHVQIDNPMIVQVVPGSDAAGRAGIYQAHAPGHTALHAQGGGRGSDASFVWQVTIVVR